MKEVKQAEIYFAYLDPVKGHEQAGNRPVLILQNDILNKHLNTVVIAPITSNLNAAGYLTTYLLDKKTSKLKTDSVVLIHQIRTIDKVRLKKKSGALSMEEFRKIKAKMTLIF